MKQIGDIAIKARKSIKGSAGSYDPNISKKLHRQAQKRACKHRTEFEFDEKGPVRTKRKEYKLMLSILNFGKSLLYLTSDGTKHLATTRTYLAENMPKDSDDKPACSKTATNRLKVFEEAGLITVSRTRYGILIRIVDRLKLIAWIEDKQKEYRKLLPLPAIKRDGDKLFHSGGQTIPSAIGTVSTEKISCGDSDQSDLEELKKIANTVVKHVPTLASLDKYPKDSARRHIFSRLEQARGMEKRQLYRHAYMLANQYAKTGESYGFDEGPQNVYKAGEGFVHLGTQRAQRELDPDF